MSGLKAERLLLNWFILKLFLHSTYTTTCSMSKFGIFLGLFTIFKLFSAFLGIYCIQFKFELQVHEKINKIWWKKHICALESMFIPYPRKRKEFWTSGCQDSTLNMEVIGFLNSKKCKRRHKRIKFGMVSSYDTYKTWQKSEKVSQKLWLTLLRYRTIREEEYRFRDGTCQVWRQSDRCFIGSPWNFFYNQHTPLHVRCQNLAFFRVYLLYLSH